MGNIVPTSKISSFYYHRRYNINVHQIFIRCYLKIKYFYVIFRREGEGGVTLLEFLYKIFVVCGVFYNNSERKGMRL